MATATQAARVPRRPPWVDILAGQALALLAAFLFAAALGSIIILLYDYDPLAIFLTVWRFSTARPQDFAYVLENATPLIFSGLAVAVAFKAGLFNIGVEGQYIVAMAAAAAVAVSFGGIPAMLLLPMVVVAAMLAGMLWAAVPAVLKVRTGAHEVVTTIMMNGIAISFVAWLILHPLRSSERALIDLRTDIFPKEALMPTVAGSLNLEDQIPQSVHLTWLFGLAIVACVLVWFLLFRTRLGYEVRAVGSSARSAEAGGISIGATQIKIFLISGALAGFVGLNHILGDKGYLGSNYETGLGFAGITVAFLGRNHPAGIPLAAILLGMLLRGQDGIAVTTDLPTEILIILQGVLILAVVVAYEIVTRALARRQLREGSEASSA
jgi:ABC-type uncharacterized transport system permease subunit